LLPSLQASNVSMRTLPCGSTGERDRQGDGAVAQRAVHHLPHHDTTVLHGMVALMRGARSSVSVESVIVMALA
jgi:hypothetical protein